MTGGFYLSWVMKYRTIAIKHGQEATLASIQWHSHRNKHHLYLSPTNTALALKALQSTWDSGRWSICFVSHPKLSPHKQQGHYLSSDIVPRKFLQCNTGKETDDSIWGLSFNGHCCCQSQLKYFGSKQGSNRNILWTFILSLLIWPNCRACMC